MDSIPLSGRATVAAGALLRPIVQNRPANGVLAAISDDAYGLLAPYLSERRAERGHVFWQGGHVAHAVFPQDGAISVIAEGGIEVGLVGCEGAVGLSRDAHSLTTGVVQVSGMFLEMPSTRFWDLAAHSPALSDMARRASEWLLIQAQVNAACNAMHDAEKRLCRWLLQVADRGGGKEITSTQEEIARLLGLRRTTLTLIAHKLQGAGVMSYKRGMIVIRDLARLESLACGCYRRHRLKGAGGSTNGNGHGAR